MIGIQDSTTSDFASIIKGGAKFVVPKFQRDYSWDKEQWDDLWQDVEHLKETNDYHYMGYLVLQNQDGKVYQIIDGQQRFTTITLLVLSVVKRIKELGNSDEKEKLRVQSLMDTYVGSLDSVTLEYNNKLVLNRNNNDYYKDYIVKLGRLRVGSMTATQKLMRGCFEFFDKKLKEGEFADYDGQQFAEFITYIVDHLYFTRINVSDEMNAFRVFETLNARGVQLSSADLLKNYLFSLVDQSEPHASRLDILEAKWTKLTNTIKTEKLPEFIRYYWNISHKSIRSKDVFKAIRTGVTDENGVFKIMDEMVSYADIYAALHDPQSGMWENAEVKSLIGLLKLFSFKQPYSTLMVAYEKLEDEDFLKLLRNIIYICFRYNVICDKNPNDQEAPFNDLAMTINETGQAKLAILSRIIVDDEQFKNAFATCSFPDNGSNLKKVRYILGKIEKFKGGVGDVSFDRENSSIEHILPQNYFEKWDIDNDEATRVVNRLGNMCLLDRVENSKLGNQTYLEKKDIYLKSEYKTTKAIGEHFNDWSEEMVDTRQKRMSDVAVSIWKIDNEIIGKN